MKLLSSSPMFKENLVYKPFWASWAVDIDQEHEKMHWIESEVPLGDDLASWKSGKILDSEKAFITNILKMFTTQDILVGTYYLDKLIPVFKNNEIRNMLAGFAVREKIHQRAYALLNDTMSLPESDYAAFLEYGEMKDKADFALEAETNTLEGLALALAKGLFNEGVSLFASFVMLLNFQRQGKMMGMSKILEFSVKDENKHCEGVSKLFRVVCEEHPKIVTNEFKQKIYTIAREIVRLEDSFIELVYEQHEIIGLTKDEVKEYIRYIADRRLNQLGLKENFKIEKNPLPWLDWIISGVQHTNFFESRSADYSVGGLEGDWNYEEKRHFAVFSKDDCIWCERAKALLTEKGHSYEETDLTDYTIRHQFFDNFGFIGKEQTTPKIFENGRLIGGFTELNELLSID